MRVNDLSPSEQRLLRRKSGDEQQKWLQRRRNLVEGAAKARALAKWRDYLLAHHPRDMLSALADIVEEVSDAEYFPLLWMAWREARPKSRFSEVHLLLKAAPRDPAMGREIERCLGNLSNPIEVYRQGEASFKLLPGGISSPTVTPEWHYKRDVLAVFDRGDHWEVIIVPPPDD